MNVDDYWFGHWGDGEEIKKTRRDCEFWTLSNGEGGVGKWRGIGVRVILMTFHQT